MQRTEDIISEITEKVSDYETNMSGFIRDVSEWGDLFRVEKPVRKARTFSNPRLTEFFRAVNTLGTMMYRMQTAQDPYFECKPMTLDMDTTQLLKIEATIQTQLRESQYKRYLLMANMGLVAFGTTIVQEDFEIVGVNSFGRRIPVTTFRPRSLLQVAFDRTSTDIDAADWLSTSDIISNSGLMRLAADAEVTGVPYLKDIIANALADDAPSTTTNMNIQNRMNKLGFVSGDIRVKPREILTYFGKLACINDGVEYICTLINRKYLIRFQANKNQHGKRNFRVAYWVEDPLTLDPIGLGVGGLLADFHKSMDSNRQKAQDGISMASYGMWGRLRSAGINDTDLKIRPLQIIDMDDANGLRPLPVNIEGASAALQLEDRLKAEFRAASGATDSLQALVSSSGTTASEVALVQNEGVRNVSVKSELAAEQLVRQHLIVCHSNNAQYMKHPIPINIGGLPVMVYPKDMKTDVDFEIKVTTDKDYKPQRLEKLIQALQILTSTKSNHPDQLQISIIPIVREIARMMGISPSEVILAQPRQPIANSAVDNTQTSMAQLPQQAPMEQTSDVVQTPVGDVLSSPT